MKKKLILIGGGGHCKSCIDVIEQENRYEIIGILDTKEKLAQEVLHYKIIGSDNDIEKFVSQGVSFLITIGQIKIAKNRVELFKILQSLGADIATVISPYAYISPYATIAKGTIIMHHALINAGASIGENCIINSKALVEHDSHIASHCHLSTGCIVNGDCKIDSQSFIGSNSCLQEGVHVKHNSFIKALSLLKRG